MLTGRAAREIDVGIASGLWSTLRSSEPDRSTGSSFPRERSLIMAEETRRRPLKKLAKRIQKARVNILERRIKRLSNRKARVQKRADS